MSNREPTSTPCVGSYARITLGSLRKDLRHRDLLLVATDRNSTGWSSEGVRISSWWTNSPTPRSAGVEETQQPELSIDSIVAFTLTPRTPIRASCLRFPGRDEGEVLTRHPPSSAWGRPPGECVEQLGLPIAFGAGDPDDLPASRVKLTGPNDWP